MTRSVMSRVAPTLSLVALLCVTAPVLAQNDSTFTWDNATELSFVSTAGNASSNTLGLKSALTGSDNGNTFKLEIGGIRASSNFTTRTALGTPDVFDIVEETRTEQSAANYYARSRYDRDVRAGFIFGGAGWERNTFAGVNHRYSFVAGLGKAWVDSDTGLFKTDLGATYTIQKDVSPAPDASDGFGGARATIEATRSVTTTTDFATTLIVDENLHDTEDLRADWLVSIAVALTEGLAFKTSYQMLFDNAPALIGVPLLDVNDNILGEVSTPSQNVDSFLTLSLVIKL
jgi:putative salt-induced outer membrane protein YdiY